jgi:hypothetical protein
MLWWRRDTPSLDGKTASIPRTSPLVRAALVVDDVLRTDETALDAMRTLEESGIRVVVLAPHGHESGRVETGGFPVVSCADGDAACWGDEPTLLLDAARRSGATPSESFMVCTEIADVSRAAEAGCRPVMVLAGRSLDDVFGPTEPGNKQSACASDMRAATSFMLQESAQAEALGAFPYAGISTLDERARAQAPSRDELTRLMAFVVVAGLTVSLGIAYLLQELYQTARFPDAFYYLTLQFIPQVARGALFLIVGAVIAFLAAKNLNRLPVRRRRV